MTDETYIYREALRRIRDLPPTQTGLGLEEARRLADNALAIGLELLAEAGR